MKKFSQYINEVEANYNKYGSRRLETDGGGGGPSLKDLVGVKMPPDEAIAAGIAQSVKQPLSQVSSVPKTSSPRLQSEPFEKGMDKSAPSVNNKLYGDKIGSSSHSQGSTEKAYNVRGVRSAKEIDDIKSSGFMNPSPNTKAGSRKSSTKYFTHTDTPKDIEGYHATVRVPSSKTPVGKAVSSKDVEVYNRTSKSWERLEK